MATLKFGYVAGRLKVDLWLLCLLPPASGYGADPLLGLQHRLFSLKCSLWISCNYAIVLLALHLVFISSVCLDVDKSTYWPSLLSLLECLTGHVAVF